MREKNDCYSAQRSIPTTNEWQLKFKEHFKARQATLQGLSSRNWRCYVVVLTLLFHSEYHRTKQIQAAFEKAFWKLEPELNEKNKDKGKMPEFYKRYVDDTLSIMPDIEMAEAFLCTLSDSHPSVNFTMELAENKNLPFLGMEIVKHDSRLKTKEYKKQIYKKPKGTGLLLHYQSHVPGGDSHMKMTGMLVGRLELNP